MKYLLSFLAGHRLGLSVFTLPTSVGMFWFNSHVIYFKACQIQIFCIHSYFVMESVLSAPCHIHWLLCVHLSSAEVLGHYPWPVSGQSRPGCHPQETSSPSSYFLTFKVFFLLWALRPLSFFLFTLGGHMLGLHRQYFQHWADPEGIHCDAGPSTHYTVLWSHPKLRDKTGLPRRVALSLANMTSYLCACLLCALGMAVPRVLHWEACPIFCSPFFMANIYLFVPPLLNPLVYSIKAMRSPCHQ